MTNVEIIQTLRELRFSSGLSEEDQGKLAAISELVKFPAGTTIFSEGDAATHVFLLSSGRVELRICAPGQGCQTLLTLEEGDLLGWSPALSHGEMMATAVTIQNTDAIRIGSAALQSLCDADHDIGYAMMRRIAIALASRLVATRLQVMDVHAHSPSSMPQPSLEEQP